MDSTRGEPIYLGYDLGNEDSYSALVVMRRSADGTLTVIESTHEPIARGGLLPLCLHFIQKYRPRMVSVRVGPEGELLPISNQTVEELLAGTKTLEDLKIATKEK